MPRSVIGWGTTNYFWGSETDGPNRVKRYVLIWEKGSGQPKSKPETETATGIKTEFGIGTKIFRPVIPIL